MQFLTVFFIDLCIVSALLPGCRTGGSL